MPGAGTSRCHAPTSVWSFAYVTIDRPAVLNALDSRTHAELSAAWDAVERASCRD